MNNAGARIEAPVNKSAPAHDAAFAFKTGFSARALIGLLGNDDFSFKVTAGAAAEERSAGWVCWHGNAEGLGGFTYVKRRSLVTLQATGMGFFGLIRSVAALSTILTLSALDLRCGLRRARHHQAVRPAVILSKKCSSSFHGMQDGTDLLERTGPDRAGSTCTGCHHRALMLRPRGTAAPPTGPVARAPDGPAPVQGNARRRGFRRIAAPVRVSSSARCAPPRTADQGGATAGPRRWCKAFRPKDRIPA